MAARKKKSESLGSKIKRGLNRVSDALNPTTYVGNAGRRAINNANDRVGGNARQSAIMRAAGLDDTPPARDARTGSRARSTKRK